MSAVRQLMTVPTQERPFSTAERSQIPDARRLIASATSVFVRCRCGEHGRLRRQHVPPHDGAPRGDLSKVHHALLAAVATSGATNVEEWVGLRPGRTSPAALRRGRARVSGCSVPLPERFTRYQHGMHDDRERASDGDHGALEAEPLSQLQALFVQIALGPAADEQHCRGLVEEPAQVAVAAPGGMPVVVDLARLVAAGLALTRWCRSSSALPQDRH